MNRPEPETERRVPPGLTAAIATAAATPEPVEFRLASGPARATLPEELVPPPPGGSRERTSA